MAPKSGQGVEEAEEEALPSPTERESVSGHLGPPAGAPAAPETPTCLPDTTPHPTRAACSADLQGCCCCCRRLALESLDPRTLRLLWKQRELEIQALRWAVQNGKDTRLCHILEEVAGIPPKRSSHSQEKFLQNQVQKLTLELKEQKDRAQWVRRGHREWAGSWCWRARLGLAWGPSAEDPPPPPTGPPGAGEGAPGGAAVADHPHAPGGGGRAAELAEVLPPAAGPLLVGGPHATIPDWQCGGEPVPQALLPQAALPSPPPLIGCLCWGALACLEACPAQAASGTLGSSREESGGLKAQVVTAETLMDPSDLSENIQAPTGEGFRLEDVDWNSIAHRYPNLFISLEPNSKQKQPRPLPQLDTGSSESSGKHSERHHKTVEWGCLPCLNTSSSGGADSDSSSCRPGLPSLVQVAGHPPRDHRASSKQALVQARSSSRDLEDLQKIHSPRHGEPLLAPPPCTDPDHWSPEHLQSPTGLKIVAVSCREKFVRIFNPSQESTADLSCMVLKQLVRGLPERLYRFPPGTLLAPRHHITVWGEGTRSAKRPPRASSGREPDPLLSSRGCATLLLSPKGEVLSEHQIPRRETPAPRVFDDGTDLSIDRFPLPEVGPGADTCKPQRPPRPLRKGRVREPRVSRRRPRTRGLLPPVSSGKLFHAREGPARPENPEIPAPQHLPTIPGDPTLPSPPAEAGLGLEDCRLQKEHRVRVCRKSVDRSCPLVALSVQSTAESRFGFRFLSCLPVTADTCRRA
ncbi:PREDICTED: lamin tail domain-containing protein 2 isoform X3 [Cercocebus atys]|uniref:lamin tail domain-containing protein 2 isoform X3 n=1 Tax=Cercocebus atys TaxID=9531 RepID=UPI0005F54CAF|nr:PREDICTED: lamin tail domain-containing protein 2 isoform X3 [Cercocebus atys]